MTKYFILQVMWWLYYLLPLVQPYEALIVQFAHVLFS